MQVIAVREGICVSPFETLYVAAIGTLLSCCAVVFTFSGHSKSYPDASLSLSLFFSRYHKPQYPDNPDSAGLSTCLRILSSLHTHKKSPGERLAVGVHLRFEGCQHKRKTSYMVSQFFGQNQIIRYSFGNSACSNTLRE